MFAKFLVSQKTHNNISKPRLHIFAWIPGSVSPKKTQKRTGTDLAQKSPSHHGPGTIGPAKAHNDCAVCLMLGNIFS